jgi:hypothetical protein
MSIGLECPLASNVHWPRSGPVSVPCPGPFHKRSIHAPEVRTGTLNMAGRVDRGGQGGVCRGRNSLQPKWKQGYMVLPELEVQEWRIL